MAPALCSWSAADTNTDRRRFLRYAGDIGLFARAPRRFGLDVGVRASLYDVQHAIAEPEAQPLADPVGAKLVKRVFDRVMEKRRDCLVFVGAVVQRDRGNAEQVRNVGNLRALPNLFRMAIGGVAKRL